MSQFQYFNDINSIFKMDGELTRGPTPRWQRKLESSMANLNCSGANTSRSILSTSKSFSFCGINQSVVKTPAKTSSEKISKKTKPTPNKNNQVPNGGDRFIPNRSTTNFELSTYLVKQEQDTKENDEVLNDQQQQLQTPAKLEHQKLMAEVMQLPDKNKSTRILSYQNKAPAPPEFHTNPLKVVYSTKTPSTTKSGTRYIPTSAERVLDAPDIINDYYLNLLDWSVDNVVSVALGNCVYLWNADTGSIVQVAEYEQGDHACSLAWMQEGQILAIGNTIGAVELWDCTQNKRLRVMGGHTARVSTLAWNSHLLSSGSRDGSIIHHDVRARNHQVATLNGHTQEVCGLKWSPDFKYLASGGNDNLVNIWSKELTGSGNTMTISEPLYTLNQHQAAVRALAWCPWQTNTLASGGGTADRCIKFWNINNGTLIKSVDTKSQVCALLWSKRYKELISAHGFANNQLTIWKYPSMIKQGELIGHTSRVLQMALSPDGTSVMSAGADETLRLWMCFPHDPTLDKKTANKVKENVFTRQSIR